MCAPAHAKTVVRAERESGLAGSQHVQILRLPSMRQCLQLHLLHLWEFAVLTPAQVDLCLRIVDGVEEAVCCKTVEEEKPAPAALPQSGGDVVPMQVEDGERMAVEETGAAQAAV